MKRSIILCCGILLALNTSAQQNIEGIVNTSNQQRVFLIHLPVNYKPGVPLPVVLLFHGGGGTYKQMQRYMGMDAIADRENFITVYPNGIDKQWNDGRDFKPAVAANDDVQFITQLLDTLLQKYAVDKNRVFVTGISNGGFFSLYLSYKLCNRLLAAAPVCANIPEKIFSSFFPAQPISLLLINGTADPLVPYAGGRVGNVFTGGRGNCISTDSTIKRFITINHTSATPLVTLLPDADAKDQCTATRYLYTGGTGNSKVCLVKITNGGHTLPGAGQYLPKIIVGRVCNDFKGSEMVWDFFKTCLPK